MLYTFWSELPTYAQTQSLRLLGESCLGTRVRLQSLLSCLLPSSKVNNADPNDLEKSRTSDSPSSHEEAYRNNFYDPDIAHPNAEYDHVLQVQCPPNTTERKLVTRIDIRVIPVLSILYLLAFLDRTNIANASIFGLQKDLGLVQDPNKYNTALTIFFVPYIVFEIPSNILLKKLKPHVWLSAC